MNEKDIVAFFPVSFAAAGEKSLITGSPNRSETRFIFSDQNGRSHIAEGYNLRKKASQIRQNRMLEFFAGNSLTGIYPFYRTLSGDHGAEYGGLFWQIRPYIPAENIPRNLLPELSEHGFLWAEFLLQLKHIISQADNPPPMPNEPFFMANFLPQLFNLAERKMPSVAGKIREFERLLAPFFKWERQAEKMFAHGDFHPGNILLGSNSIKTVIDWEFAGMKFPGYDMALLIGCLAMDHPQNLDSPAVRALQDTLCRNDFMPDSAWEFLPQMIASTRLGWLGEWLSMDEEALVLQEIALLSILLEV